MSKHYTDITDVHEDGENTVVNLSGDPGQALRPRTTMPRRPGTHPSPMVAHRRQVEINATTGERLDAHSALDLMLAAQYAERRRHAEQNDRSVTGYIRHVFGLNRDGGR